jgi:hypothetical protein
MALLKQIATDVRAIRRAVDPTASGDEVRPSVRKKDPRALYRDS